MDALKGVKVIEIVGLAPVPFCGQILADFGADVTLVEVRENNHFYDYFYLPIKYTFIFSEAQFQLHRGATSGSTQKAYSTRL